MPPPTPALPPQMEVLVFGETASTVSRERLRQWLVNICVDVYGQSTDDPRIQIMLAGLPAEVRLV